VLVIGVSALAAEVMKNVVLAGVGALHILDDTPPTATDLCANFLLPEHVIGKKGMKVLLLWGVPLRPRAHFATAL
jgi:molybdopterin/thiamine biosynthesis adenylyltransferase